MMRRFRYAFSGAGGTDHIEGVLFSDGTIVCRADAVTLPELRNTFQPDGKGEAGVRAYFALGPGELKFLDD